MSSVATELLNKLYKIINPDASNPLDRTKSRKRPADEVPELTRKFRRVSDFPNTYPAVLVDEPRRTYVIPVDKPFRSRFSNSGVFGMSKYSKDSRKLEPDYADIEYSDDDQDVIYISEKVAHEQQPGPSSTPRDRGHQRNSGVKSKLYVNGGGADEEEDTENRRHINNRPRMVRKSPPFLTRGALMLSRVPGLNPIDRSQFKPASNPFRQTNNASTSILQNGSVDGILKWGNSNLFDLKNNNNNHKVNNLSSSSTKSPLVKTNLNSLVTKTMNLDERHKYFDLLKSCAPDLYNDTTTASTIPKTTGHDRSTQKTKINVLTPVRTRYIPIEIADENDDVVIVERSSRSGSKDASPQNICNKSPDVTPVNSLRNKFLLRAEFQDGWLSNISKKYEDIEQQRKETIIQQTESLNDLTVNTKQTELDIQKKLQDVCIVSSDVVQIDESSPEASDIEVAEFPELSSEDKRFIDHVTRMGPDDLIIKKFGYSITRSDLRTLIGFQWLNDEVINFYMNLLAERSELCSSLPRVYAFNTFFLPKYMSDGHSQIRRWTKKVNIFSYDIIPVPVHVGKVHWCMAIIHFKEKSVKYYDSMGKPNAAALRAIENYLKEESLDKLKIEFPMHDWVLESAKSIPLQQNGSDCGVFSCMFAEYITRNKPLTFAQKNMPYFRQKMIFEIAKGKLLT